MSLEIQHANLRDLGGLPTENGACVREGRLIRSGALWSLEEWEQRMLPPVLAVFDMRGQREREFRPNPPFMQEKCRCIPVMRHCRRDLAQSKRTLEDKVLDILKGYAAGEPGAEVRMCETYRNMAFSETMNQCMGEIIRLLARKNNGAVIWHCAVGKDRTGFMAAVLLRLLHVPDTEIYADYLRSNEMLQEEIDTAERIARSYADSEKAADYVKAFFAADPLWLQAGLEATNSRGDTLEEYVLRYAGVSEEELSAFCGSCLTRQNYCCETQTAAAPSVCTPSR